MRGIPDISWWPSWCCRIYSAASTNLDVATHAARNGKELTVDQLSMFGSWKALTRKRMEAGKEMKVVFLSACFPMSPYQWPTPAPKILERGCKTRENVSFIDIKLSLLFVTHWSCSIMENPTGRKINSTKLQDPFRIYFSSPHLSFVHFSRRSLHTF